MLVTSSIHEFFTEVMHDSRATAYSDMHKNGNNNNKRYVRVLTDYYQMHMDEKKVNAHCSC